jgi:hypothetical protein
VLWTIGDMTLTSNPVAIQRTAMYQLQYSRITSPGRRKILSNVIAASAKKAKSLMPGNIKHIREFWKEIKNKAVRISKGQSGDVLSSPVMSAPTTINVEKARSR